MPRWRLPILFAASFAAALLAASWNLEASAQSENEPAPAGETSGATAVDTPVERGRYLVNDVAMCVQCHSARTESGDIAPSKLMRGAPLPVEGPDWSEAWAYIAPDVVTLARGRPDYVIGVLTTGKRPDGTEPQRPMPPFRLSDEDAEAVVAYLKTLK